MCVISCLDLVEESSLSSLSSPESVNVKQRRFCLTPIRIREVNRVDIALKGVA